MAKHFGVKIGIERTGARYKQHVMSRATKVIFVYIGSIALYPCKTSEYIGSRV